MSTTSPNFNLVLATTADQVNVVTQIANNFSSLDSILAVVHTGSGQLKPTLSLTTPVLINPSISGTASGAGIMIASTGQFNTITATGGVLTVNAFSIGSYSIPSTIGATNQLLTVVTGNAQWVAAAPGTGANQSISNLASVAINTSLNTFSAGFVTVDRLITTSGALTGLTSFQATAGTFAGNVTISGTATINVVNCTGGAITAGGLAVGTYSYPSTVGSTGFILAVTTGNLVFATNPPKIGLVSANTVTSTAESQSFPITSNKNYSIYVNFVAASQDALMIRFNGDIQVASYESFGLVSTTARGVLISPLMGSAQGGVAQYSMSLLSAGGLSGTLLLGQAAGRGSALTFYSTVVAGMWYSQAATGFTLLTTSGNNFTAKVNIYEIATN